VALPAFLLSNPAFAPVIERFEGQGAEVRHEFAARGPESLYLEYEVVLRASGNVRPAVGVRLNGRAVATLAVDALSAQQLGRTLLPSEAVHAGLNQLVVATEGGADATIELRARLHNYFGIAPDPPRAAVVSDAAWRWWWDETSFPAMAGHLLAICTGGLLVVWLFQGLLPSGASAWALCAPAVFLVPLLLWALASPLHVWLFPETLVLLVLAPGCLVAATAWLRRRRVAVFQMAGVTAVTLVLLEVSLRAMNAVNPSFIFYADSYGRYRGRPGAPHHGSTLNSRGFNDREHTIERPAEVMTRIVALGDSFAFGVVPRPANYLTLIEQELSSAGAVEIINLGVSGTEPRDYRAILVDEGLRFQPDLVLVSVYVGNDLEVRSPRWYERSYVTTLANFVWHLNRARQTVVVAEGALAEYHDEEPSMDDRSFTRIQMERAWLYTSADARLEAAVNGMISDIGEIQTLARGAGADCMVVLIPDETQVDSTLQDEVARAWGRTRGSLDFERPSRVVRDSLARAGIPAIDLLPAFRQAGADTQLYKPRDTHWNLAGNRLGAETIIPALREWQNRRREGARLP